MTMSVARVPPYVEQVVNPYGSEDSECRRGLMVGGAWVDEIPDYIRSNKITALYLNYARGWSTKDYAFLSELQMIEELDIIDGDVENLHALEAMTGLEELSISCHTKEIIDFSALPRLVRCSLDFWSGATSIFTATGLQTLCVDCLKLRDYSVVANLTGLSSLTISNSPIPGLDWLKALNGLVALALTNCRMLSDFSAISELSGLRALTIDGSKRLCTLDFLTCANRLEFLDISNNSKISTLLPLKGNQNLREVVFVDDTVIVDGDLSVLAELPELCRLDFNPKRHYTHRLIKVERDEWAIAEPLLAPK